MVVFIHTSFYGIIGIMFNTLARFAVPLFFLISGFYSYQISCEKIKKRIRNIATLLILSIISYVAFKVLVLVLNGNYDELYSYFSNYFNVFVLVKLLVFNMPISYEHLWYLFAIFYVYVFFYFATKFRMGEKTIYISSFLLLLLHILFGEVFSAFGIVLPVFIVRNFALMGIPFFALGLFVKKNIHLFNDIPNYVIFVSIIIGVLESLLSRCFCGINELYVGSLLILFSLVCIFIKYSDVQYPSFFISFDGCSTYIYIFHSIISAVIKKIYVLLGYNIDSSILIKNIHPILVCVTSTTFAYFVVQILRKLTKNKTRLYKNGA